MCVCEGEEGLNDVREVSVWRDGRKRREVLGRRGKVYLLSIVLSCLQLFNKPL